MFYFCGHGFEEAGKTFLMPIDADPQWTTDSAISAESILSKIQHCKTTKLDVLLLDVCRVRSVIVYVHVCVSKFQYYIVFWLTHNALDRLGTKCHSFSKMITGINEMLNINMSRGNYSFLANSLMPAARTTSTDFNLQ